MPSFLLDSGCHPPSMNSSDADSNFRNRFFSVCMFTLIPSLFCEIVKRLSEFFEACKDLKSVGLLGPYTIFRAFAQQVGFSCLAYKLKIGLAISTSLVLSLPRLFMLTCLVSMRSMTPIFFSFLAVFVLSSLSGSRGSGDCLCVLVRG